MKKAYLVLSNGRVFEGFRFGAEGTAVGELVFTTGVCGYLETLTDAAYCGQIILQTFPLIGNYGVIEADLAGACHAAGYVVREWCDAPSNFRCQGDLDAFLREKGVPGIWGVDTRELTGIIRDSGTVNAVICDAVPADLQAVADYKITGAVARVTTAAPVCHPAEQEKYRVTLMDFGVGADVIRALNARGCSVTVVPASTSAREILAAKPDGVLLSGGPGDPAENTAYIDTVRQLIGQVPLFGIGLGHQILALAMGGKTEKLPCGHRGTNQPVRDLQGSRTYITTQNHGYAVVSDSLPAGTVRFVNVNDGSCEGAEYTDKRAFSVQFTPDGGPFGQRDTGFLYDTFVTMMGGDR